MRHLASVRFWTRYHALPAEIREQADRAYALLRTNPRHRSLHLKRVGRLWSARISEHYRVLGIDIDQGILWLWIGTHGEYDRLLRTQMRDLEAPSYA